MPLLVVKICNKSKNGFLRSKVLRNQMVGLFGIRYNPFDRSYRMLHVTRLVIINVSWWKITWGSTRFDKRVSWLFSVGPGCTPMTAMDIQKVSKSKPVGCKPYKTYAGDWRDCKNCRWWKCCRMVTVTRRIDV